MKWCRVLAFSPALRDSEGALNCPRQQPEDARHGQLVMLIPENRRAKKAFQLPRLAVGDILLVGKFKNRKATITGFSSDENNQPVAQTDKGEHKIFKPRIAKLMPAK
jgi:hypothetical protein